MACGCACWPPAGPGTAPRKSDRLSGGTADPDGRRSHGMAAHTGRRPRTLVPQSRTGADEEAAARRGELVGHAVRAGQRDGRAGGAGVLRDVLTFLRDAGLRSPA